MHFDGTYTSLTHPDGDLVLKARNIDAKQALWGWASDRNAGEMSLYGSSVGSNTDGDRQIWYWKLSPSAARSLLAAVKSYQGKMSKSETTVTRRLVKVLEQFLGIKHPSKKGRY